MCLLCAMHCAMLSFVKTQSDLIGSAEACRILEIHAATLGRWVKNGTLKAAHKLPGDNGAYLFKRAAVEKLAAQRTKAAS